MCFFVSLKTYSDCLWCSFRLKAVNSHEEPDLNYLNDTILKITDSNTGCYIFIICFSWIIWIQLIHTQAHLRSSGYLEAVTAF